MPDLTPQQALEEVESARRAVDAADRRTKPMLLTAAAALTFLDYAAKDHLPVTQQRVVTGVTQTAITALSVLEVRASPVSPYEPADAPNPRTAVIVGAAAVGWYAAERLAVGLLRRSRLSRPNTVAGAVLALTRSAGAVLTYRLLPRAGRDA